MSIWVITFKSLDQVVTVRNCADKKEAIKAALRIARRADPEISKEDVRQCKQDSAQSPAARTTGWPVHEHKPKQTGAHLDRHYKPTPPESDLLTGWLE